jgi:hypothetical protein
VFQCSVCGESFKRSTSNFSNPTTESQTGTTFSVSEPLEEPRLAVNQTNFQKDQLRAWADKVTIVGGFLFAIGLLAAIVSVIRMISGGVSSIGWMITSGCLASSFWLYLIAQIIHIRANTEK